MRSQIGWGASINPDRIGLSSEGGWNGGDHRAVVNASVEATVYSRASVFARAAYGGIYDHVRPAIGAAYQLLDPRAGRTGLRLSLAYKPGGLTEPEDEIESVLVMSRRFRGVALRGMLAYGQDPEGRESDYEIGASFMHHATARFVVGATSRYRRAIKIKTTAEPRWDFIGGCVAGLVLGRSRVEVLVGRLDRACDHADRCRRTREHRN